MPSCPTCKVVYMDGESHNCGEVRRWPALSSSRQDALPRIVSQANAANALSVRYRDGYRKGMFIAGFGQFVKIAGAVLGVIIAVAGLYAYQTSAIGGSLAVMFACVIAGGILALTFFVLGVIISAEGQLLLAALDTAVNSSPFLTDDQRAQIIF